MSETCSTCSSSSVVRKYSVVSFGVQVLTGIGDTSESSISESGSNLKAFAGVTVALNMVKFCKLDSEVVHYHIVSNLQEFGLRL
jgi:hypothetical protein